MTDLDERLAEALRAAVPEPPHQLDPEAIRDRSVRRHRTRRRYTPALAAAVVVAVAVGIALTRGGGGNDKKPTPVGDPADLFGVVWRVQTVDGIQPGTFQTLTLQIERNGKFLQRVTPCVAVEGRLTISSTQLSVDTAESKFGDACLSMPPAHGQHEFLQPTQHMFVGRIAWSIHADRLTLRKAGGPTVVYTRWRAQGEPGSFTAELVLDRTTVPANGESISGSLILDNETGEPVVIAAACNGWYAIGLTNDHVKFEGGWSLVYCASEKIPIGTTRIPIYVATTYVECAMRGPEPPTPACLGPAHDQMPPLPPGEYTTKVEFNGLSRDPTLAPPLNVTLTQP